MRDDSTGEVIKNAHLLGFFRRIVKLLCIRVRPVFVFDGATPALKRQTVQARRAQRKHADTRLKVVAEKLLIQRMREHTALVVRVSTARGSCARSASRVPR
jgi:DNA excision repair protein ERCC-5